MTEKPTPPGEYECCESGCEPCVWDIYNDELKAWQAAQKAKEQEAITPADDQPADAADA